MPISVQDKVDKEIDRLIKEGHIIILQECSDKYFVSPIVIRVKKDGSIKLALESRELNKQVHMNKYQITNIDKLVDGISKIIAERKVGGCIFYNIGFHVCVRTSFIGTKEERTVQFFISRRKVDSNISF